jgi:hypothetical protein
MTSFGGSLEGDLTFCSGRPLPRARCERRHAQTAVAFPNDTSPSGFAVAGARRWTSVAATTSTAISVGAYPRRARELVASGGPVQGAAPIAWRPFFMRPHPGRRTGLLAKPMGSRRCCTRAAKPQSQLLRGWTCAYTPAHQDSATISAKGLPFARRRALSSVDDSADIRSAAVRTQARCVNARETILRGFKGFLQ